MVGIVYDVFKPYDLERIILFRMAIKHLRILNIYLTCTKTQKNNIK